jgi:hypothetical protein
VPAGPRTGRRERRGQFRVVPGTSNGQFNVVPRTRFGSPSCSERRAEGSSVWTAPESSRSPPLSPNDLRTSDGNFATLEGELSVHAASASRARGGGRVPGNGGLVLAAASRIAARATPSRSRRTGLRAPRRSRVGRAAGPATGERVAQRHHHRTLTIYDNHDGRQPRFGRRHGSSPAGLLSKDRGGNV